MPEEIKILMFNNEFPPLGGGTGTVNLELFNNLKTNNNIKIDLITSAFGKKKEIIKFSDNITIYKYPVKKKDIHHASNSELLRYALKATIAGLKLCKKNNYDLTMVWSAVPAGLPALILKIFKKIPYSVRVGGPDIPGFEKRYDFIYKIISPFIKTVWKNADSIIAKCKTEKEMIQKINPEIKVKIIYNGVDTKKFKPGKKKTNKNIRIISPARLIKRKGQYTLIDAVSKLKNDGIKITADLVGEGDEKNAYIKYAEKKNVSKEIIFSGYVPGEKMPEKYNEADIFVLASYNEGMSNALLEAVACGLPVAVTDVGGTEEIVDADNGFIFKPGDANALYNILKNMIKNKELIRKYGQNSVEKAKKFNISNTVGEYLKLFQEIKNKSEK
ncbi:MAG: glycosyltransferase family 4 protein [Chlorobi bacterium]|nr:glycosyltransferase family 4 protein [Chlorobiota bacterium]